MRPPSLSSSHHHYPTAPPGSAGCGGWPASGSSGRPARRGRSSSAWPLPCVSRWSSRLSVQLEAYRSQAASARRSCRYWLLEHDFHAASARRRCRPACGSGRARSARPGRSRGRAWPARGPRCCSSRLCTGMLGGVKRAAIWLWPKRNSVPNSLERVLERRRARPCRLSPTPRMPTTAMNASQHVVGPFADHVDAGVAHHALVRLVGEVALAAVDLHRVVDDLPQGVGGQDLEHGGFEHVVLGAAVDEGGALRGRRLHGEGVGGHEGDLLLDQLELARASA